MGLPWVWKSKEQVFESSSRTCSGCFRGMSRSGYRGPGRERIGSSLYKERSPRVERAHCSGASARLFSSNDRFSLNPYCSRVSSALLSVLPLKHKQEETVCNLRQSVFSWWMSSSPGVVL